MDKNLRWQCRRGMRELDLLLQAYFDRDYLQADEKECLLFSQLLQESDALLYDCLLLQKKPENLAYQSLLTKIILKENTQ